MQLGETEVITLKVILLKDVAGTGKKGQLVEVSDGHAKNFLIPKKLASEATKSNINDLEQKRASAEAKQKRELDAANELAQSLNEKRVSLKVRTGENGKVFGSVTSKEIAEALSSIAGISIDKKKIALDEPIKQVGEHKVQVKIYPRVSTTIIVSVESQ